MFSTPWLLHWLGVERFGTFRVLLDWVAYVGLLELGLGGALWARLAVALGKGEKATAQNLLVAGLRAYFLVMLVMVGVGLGLMVALPYFVKTVTVGHDELRLAWLCCILPIIIFPLSVFRLLADARQQSYLVSLLFTLQSLLTIGLLLITAWAGWGLIGQSLAIGLGQFPAIFILMWIGLRAYPIRWLSKPEPEARRAIRALNWPMFIYNTSFRVGILSDTIVLAWVMGPTAVVPFFLTQRLATLAQNQLMNIGNSTWAGLVELQSQGHLDTFRTRLLELTSLVSGLSLAILIPIATFNYHFIARWVGSSNYAGDAVNILVCLNIWLWAVFYLWGWTLSGTGQIAHWTPYALSFTIINLAVSITGTLMLGMVGPLLGTLVSFLLVTSWGMPRILKRIFGLSPYALWRNALLPFLWALPYAIILGIIARARTPSGWAELIMEMSLASLFGLALWWMLGLSGSDRTIWRARLQGALGR
ncbi:MAG: lipopolysaccharide biosynthesis protein [Pyrinomonadaceae bacterium]|nr:lipopolysaccharide biosynthesis protein [Pyrinomonadaceae bacterium]